MFRRILVPLDGSRFAEHAVPQALALAARWGADLALATVADPAGTVSASVRSGRVDESERDRAMTGAGEYLEEVRERIVGARFEGVVSSEVIPAGNVAVSLARHVLDVEADLMVMTSHSRGPIQRAWLGSTADGLIRRSPVPVLLMRPDEAQGDTPVDFGSHPRAFASVLIPLDGSDASEKLLELARPFTADAERPRFILLRAVPPFVPGGSPYLPHVVREGHEQEQVKEAARGYLERVAARLAESGVELELEVVTAGQPAVGVLRTAEELGVDMIAMSTHGRGGVARLLLGSVADKVARGTPVPVLLYREPE
jgi:nucleotide-binding universal stress UspA family protein